MIRLKNIEKNYTSRKGVVTRALKGISLDFEQTGMVFVLGKSGSGKSTLLNILAGLDTADQGEFLIDGERISDFSKKKLETYRNANVGMVFQDFNIVKEYSVWDNIALALKLQGQKADKEKMQAMINRVGLEGLENRPASEVSGGQKQRIAIARALIKSPRIILADEPTGNLDSKTSTQILDLLKEISKETMVIVVSHDLDEAEAYADRIIQIKDGLVFSDQILNQQPASQQNFKRNERHISFLSSMLFGLKRLVYKKRQLLLTVIVLSLVMVFVYLLSSYLYFLKDADINLVSLIGMDAVQSIREGMKLYLAEDNAKDILFVLLAMIIGIAYVFISMSINERKKEIGLFKALGASHLDVIKVFVWEGMLISLSSWALSSVLAYAYTITLNGNYFSDLTIFRLNQQHVLLAFGLLVSCFIIYTFLIILNILRKEKVMRLLRY